jgi:hypothetical protein
MHLERWRALSAAMAMVAAGSVPASGRERDCAVETRLQWVDVVGLAPFAYAAVAGEMASSLAGYGVCSEVSRASPASVRSNGEIGVILLRSMAGSGVGRHVLGATRSRDARNPTVWVYFDEVATVLGLAGRPTGSWSAIERTEFGRALGRVAAHEVVHALLPERPHDRAGLMSPSFGRRELTASTLDIQPGLRADVRRASPEW